MSVNLESIGKCEFKSKKSFVLCIYLFIDPARYAYLIYLLINNQKQICCEIMSFGIQLNLVVQPGMIYYRVLSLNGLQVLNLGKFW